MSSRLSENIIKSSIEVKESLLNDSETLDKIDQVAKVIAESLDLNKNLYICGNGGSASDAEHIAAELSGRFYKDRPALKCHALNSNNAYLTAVSNDYGYENIYSRLVEGWMTEGDILIGISTSGNSMNIVNAIKTAKNKNIFTVGLLGRNNGLIGDLANVSINIDSTVTPRIQESHILVGHIICELIESSLF